MEPCRAAINKVWTGEGGRREGKVPLRCGPREEDAVSGTEAQASTYPGSDPHSEAGAQPAPSSRRRRSRSSSSLPPPAERSDTHDAAPPPRLSSCSPPGSAPTCTEPRPERHGEGKGAAGARPPSPFMPAGGGRGRGGPGAAPIRHAPAPPGWAGGAPRVGRAGVRGGGTRGREPSSGWRLCGRAPVPAPHVPGKTVLSVLFHVNRGSAEAETPRGKRANPGTAAEL